MTTTILNTIILVSFTIYLFYIDISENIKIKKGLKKPLDFKK